MARLRPARRQLGRPQIWPLLLPHRLVQRREPLVEPGGHGREAGGDERVDQLVDQRAAAGADVHEQRLVLGQEEAVRRRRALAVEADGVVDVAVAASQQPDVDDVRRLAHVEVALEMADGPVDRLRVVLDARRRFVADDEERAGDAGRVAVGDLRLGLQLHHVLRVRGQRDAGTGIGGAADVDLARLQRDADRRVQASRAYLSGHSSRKRALAIRL